MSNASDFIIENGILKKYVGPGGDVVVPEGVTEIGDEAFRGCNSLTGITVQEGVSSIGKRAFYNCSRLTDINLPASVKRIDDWAFNGCSSLPGITLPKGIEIVGFSAFSDCSSLTSIVLPSDVSLGNCLFDGCYIKQIIVLGKVPKFGKQNIGSIWSDQPPAVEFPEMDLITREKLPALAAEAVHIQSAEEYAWVWCFQTGKTWDHALTSQNVEANEVVKQFETIISEEGKLPASFWKRVAEYLELNRTGIQKASISGLLKAAEAKDKKAAATLRLNSAVQKYLEECDEKETHPVEKRVKALMEMTPEFASALREIPAGICYKYSDTVCDPIVPAFVISEYMKLHDPESTRNYSLYETACTPYALVPPADEIAGELDQAQFLELLEKLAFDKGGTFILPFARFADESHAASLVRQMAQWENWGKFGGVGRKNIIIARCGLLLSETKTAMLHLDHVGKLDVYAAMRSTDADTLRDTVLSDFGFDQKRTIRYNLGGNELLVSIGTDLSLHMFDTATGRETKSIPKKNADPQRVNEVKKQIADLKKNIKKVLTNRKDKLFHSFLNGDTQNAAAWQEIYLNNPVLNSMARLLVWNQGRRTFTLSDDGAVDSTGNTYSFDDNPVGVAYPTELEPAVLEAWQKHFASCGMKQPFAQVWEPVHRAEDIQENRYAGSKLPLYRFVGKEKHGITTSGFGVYSEEYSVCFTDCTLELMYLEGNLGYDAGRDSIVTLGRFTIQKYTRYSNHIVGLLDQWTISDRVRKDDLSVMDLMGGFTLAQITEFITAAQEANAVNVLAALLEYKNAHFADFDPMDEFTLEW